MDHAASRVSILANFPSRQTFGGFSSLSAQERSCDVERVKLDQFKLVDNRINKQRLILYHLSRQKTDLIKKKMVMDTSPKAGVKWAKAKERLSVGLDIEDMLPKRKSAKEKLNDLLSTRKSRYLPSKNVDNQSYTLNLMKLAIRDQNQTTACKLLHTLNMKNVVKKNTVFLNNIFLMALNSGMDNLAIFIMENNFPKSVNDPIIAVSSNHHHAPLDHYPSYFLAAIAVGSENLVKYMVKRGAHLNSSWFGLSPLHLACCLRDKGNAQLVKYLLDNNADPTLYLLYQQYILLLQLKIEIYHDQASSSLLPNGSQKYCLPPRRAADATKKVAMHLRKPTLPVDHRVIMAAHAVPIFPLEVAAAVTNLEAVVALLKRLEGTTILNRFRYPLIIQQDVDTSIRLLKAGANMAQRTTYGSTPLHLAARTGNVELIAVYLYFNMPVDVEDDEGWTPLHEAAFFNQHEAVKYLISQGADCNVKNLLGDAPVQVALKSGFASEEILSFFEKSQSEFDDGFVEKKMNVEQLIAEIGDVRFGDANLRRKTRFFNFKGSKSRFTIERLNDSISTILPLERIHSRSPNFFASSSDGGATDLRRCRTMSSDATMSRSLAMISSSPGAVVDTALAGCSGKQAVPRSIYSRGRSPSTNSIISGRKCSSSSDLSATSAASAISSPSTAASPTAATGGGGSTSSLSRRTSSSFGSVSTLSKLFSSGKTRASTKDLK